MTILSIDFETFSACELKDRGLANYAADPSTGVHCMAFAFDDEPVCHRAIDEKFPYRLFEHVIDGGLVYAHNAPFELAIWNSICVPKYGWPVLKPEQCRCTMAMAYAMSLPGALENVAPALGLSQRKDSAGKRIMLQLAKPKADGTFWRYEDAPDKFEALYAYCRQDVEVERAVHGRLMDLSPQEQELWTLDYRINQRGVRADISAIESAITLVQTERQRLDKTMLRTTGGVVGSCSEVQLLVKWIRSQGVELPGVAKSAVLDALSGELPANVRKALELRKEAAKSSTAKLIAMKERASVDGRIRGLHQFHGANTGRWAGRGIQVQNLPRPRPHIKPEDVEDILSHLDDRAYVDTLYGPTMDAMADCVRGVLVPAPSKQFIACDFSAIEARVLAWLAGEEKVLDTFRRKEDIYKVAAGGIYQVKPEAVAKDQRQIGKVAILALGYGGGVGAFQSMARNYGVKVRDEEAEAIKQAWRKANSHIVQYWWELENAAIKALVTGEGEAVGEGGVSVRFRKRGSFLWCKLPSGRVLCYPYPELRTVTTPWGDEKEALTYMTVVSDPKSKTLPDPASSGTWKRVSTYGGSLAENVTQAVARDLLADAMTRIEAEGFQVCAHVHDEVVCEADEACDDRTLERIESMMSTPPAWAAGLPLAAEGWRGTRYRK